jgi:ABC-2 type transport system ATP-binding protein
MDAGAAIEVQGLTKRYGSHVAVDGVSLTVDRSEVFGILGPNGAGKTTTLEMIEGLREPDAGDVTVLGHSVWPDPRSIQALIGVQLQTTSLFDMLTARELLVLFARFYLRADADERAESSLAQVSPSPSRSSTTPRSCSWTSPRPGSIRRPAATSGT